ncbi:MAG: helix-turn-helix domain-containing protein [Oscillospiraceae bacterium]|jgi:transcriptional regulator with XRE-family HTH domain|nr:helix-turn-helix domain-containing protein [Oscillospiraceae bacterium]
MINIISVGNRIFNLRKQSKLTQDELSEKLGISAQAISKWENGHTLPETVLLPVLAKIFDCSIDSILMPFAVLDAAFFDFIHAADSKSAELAIHLYERMKNKFDFTIEYNDEYKVHHDVSGGRSAKFRHSDEKSLDFRMDVNIEQTGENVLGRVALPNCSKYMYIINNMPEHIKEKFRLSDCTHCQGSECRACMIYTFEDVDYRQCHFITIAIDCAENMDHIFTLLCAEYER